LQILLRFNYKKIYCSARND